MIERVRVTVIAHDDLRLVHEVTPIEIEAYKGDLLKDVYLTLEAEEQHKRKETTAEQENNHG